jgi:Uncharacterized conserved protein
MSNTTTTTNTTLDGLATGTWNIDAAHSAFGFQVRHLMVSKVKGKFDEFTATLTVGETLEDSSVEAEVKMTSINTGVADRDNHLRTNDFFEVETYPTMTFKSTKVTETELTGDLTIKNVTKPVTFDVEFGGVGSDPWGVHPRRLRGLARDQPQGVRRRHRDAAPRRRRGRRRQGQDHPRPRVRQGLSVILPQV